MKFSTGLFILMILSFLLTSCEKDKSGITASGEMIFTSYFPNNIGTQWTYFYYDSLANQSDTVAVQVVGDTTFEDNRKARIWEYRFQSATERKYVEISEDTVKIYDDLNTLWINTKFIMPFEVGKKWGGDFLLDSSYVIEKLPITVIANRFTESYKIKEIWGGLNDYGLVYTWFVPGVGIVKRHHRGWSFGMANKYWELMNYKVE